MFGTTFFMYDNGLKNNVETPRLDLGVVIYVGFNLFYCYKFMIYLIDFFLYRTQTF